MDWNNQRHIKINTQTETFNTTKTRWSTNGEFSRYSVYKTRKGELLFGGTYGFNSFYPDSIHHSDVIPPVFITGFVFSISL